MRSTQQDWVLVTGGSGFVGASLVNRLLSLGYKVRVISRSAPAQVQEERGQLRRESRLEWFIGDISCFNSIRDAFIEAKYVFHVAALVDSTAPYDQFEEINVKGTENVCELSIRNGVAKLIHVSTSDVFGLPASVETITEETPYREWNEPYPDSKIRAAGIVKTYQSKGLVSSIIYPGWVYGPGDRSFLPALLRQLKKGYMPLWSPKGCELHLVFVEDLIDGLLKAATCTAADNQDFLILDDASGVDIDKICRHAASFFGLNYRSLRVPYRLIYLWAWLSQRLARIGVVKRPLVTTTDVKSFGWRFRFSTLKAQNLLGWSPRTPFSVGIQIALQWQAANANLGSTAD